MAFINKINNQAVDLKINSKPNTNDGFADILKKEIENTNETLTKAEKLEADIATGQVKDLAKATITIQKAEMQMKMMLEVRNKAISAYKELLKTQI